MLPLRARVNLDAMQRRDPPHFPKLQHHWSLRIRLFIVITRILVEGVLPLCREAVGVFYSPNRLGQAYRESFTMVLCHPNIHGILICRRLCKWVFPLTRCHHNHTYTKRHSQCNGYDRWKWTRRPEFKSWKGVFAFHFAHMLLQEAWTHLFSLQLWKNSWADLILLPW